MSDIERAQKEIELLTQLVDAQEQLIYTYQLQKIREKSDANHLAIKANKAQEAKEALDKFRNPHWQREPLVYE